MVGQMKRIFAIVLVLTALWPLPSRAQLGLNKATEEEPAVNRNLEIKQKIKFFKDEIARHPQDPSAYYDAAIFYWGIEWQRKAIGLFNQAVTLQPQNAELIFDIGMFYAKQGQTNRAQKYFTNALRLDPKNADMVLKIGVFYGDIDQMGRAQKYFRRALQINPGSETYLQVGLMYMKHGYFNQGAEYLSTALKAGPENPGMYMQIGKSYLENGFFDRAVFYCDRALKMLSADAEAYVDVGFAFWSKGFDAYQAQGMAYLERTGKIFPDNDALQFSIGTEFLGLGAPEAATRFFGQALRIQPAKADLYFKIGSAYINYLKLEETSPATGRKQYREPASYEEMEIFDKGLAAMLKGIEMAREEEPSWHWAVGLLYDVKGMGTDAIYHLIMARELFIIQERSEGKVQEGNSEEVRAILRRYYEKYGYVAEDFDVPGFKGRLF